MHRGIFIAALTLVPALSGCEKKPPPNESMTPADVQELDALLTAATTRAEGFIAARDQGLRLAARGLVPRPSAPPCPETILRPEPLGDADTRLTGDALAAQEAARWRMNVVPDWAVAGGSPPEPLKPIQKVEVQFATLGPRHDQFDRQYAMLRQLQAAGKYDESWSREAMLKIAREIGSDDYWGWELDVVTALQNAPTQDGSDTFNGGFLLGTAFLWSFPKGRVVCVADVKATNQERIKLSIDPKNKTPQQHQRLNDDLKNEAFRSAIAGLTEAPLP
jgi:hypothetical protein